MARSLLSIAIVAGTLGFLAWFGFRHAESLPDLTAMNAGFWTHAAIAFLWYNVATIMTAVIWRWLLRSLGDDSRLGVAESVFLITQAAKYFPGNVTHIIGRVALAKVRGIAVSIASASILCEQALVLLAAVVLFVLGFLLAPELLRPIAPYIPAAPWVAAVFAGAMLVSLFAGFLVAWMSGRLPERLQRSLHEVRNLGPIRVVSLIAAYCVPFLILGVVVMAAADAVAGAAALSFPVAALVFVAAWTIGFLTPGAPAGVGVRETIIVVGLAPVLGEGSALTLAVLMRLISVAGDASSFLIGLAGDHLSRHRRSVKTV